MGMMEFSAWKVLTGPLLAGPPPDGVKGCGTQPCIYWRPIWVIISITSALSTLWNQHNYSGLGRNIVPRLCSLACSPNSAPSVDHM
jgi:hypothetical protein